MREPVTAYLGLGANLGDARATVAMAIADIARCDGVVLTAQSALYRTAPIASSGPDYINAVVEVRTVLTAPALLQCLHSIETAAGRARPYRNAPRTLDLDILLFGDGQIGSPHLSVPHPRMGQRAFVLVPLAEIAPHRVDAPALQVVLEQAIERLD
ncbi:MAG: 2-amino-4-hydroxy-6-hydroxymethyldihydropteridine diphosphokinase [Burkholderiales bacterium]|nr:2-amino-4-hydroxy-6-hydroxymethyldihydropteridine diphosphokinase [Burkholderiales bacterium]